MPRGKVFVLTDEGCISACLDAIDIWTGLGATADVAPMAQHPAYATWRAWALAYIDTLDPLQGRTAPFRYCPRSKPGVRSETFGEHGSEEIGLARQPITVPIHAFTVGWIPPRDVLPSLPSSVSAVGEVLIGGPLAH